MKEIVRYGSILALITAMAAGFLAGVNYLTRPKIIARAKAEERASLKQVIPGAEKFEPVKSGSDIIYYKAYNKHDKFMGVAFKAAQKGYSSIIETMVGMTEDGLITAIKVLRQNETPGLGAEIAEPSFIGEFSNKNIQDLNKIQAITGASISSEAVIDSVKEKAEEIQALIKNERG